MMKNEWEKDPFVLGQAISRRLYPWNAANRSTMEMVRHRLDGHNCTLSVEDALTRALEAFDKRCGTDYKVVYETAIPMVTHATLEQFYQECATFNPTNETKKLTVLHAMIWKQDAAYPDTIEIVCECKALAGLYVTPAHPSSWDDLRSRFDIIARLKHRRGNGRITKTEINLPLGYKENGIEDSPFSVLYEPARILEVYETLLCNAILLEQLVEKILKD